MIRALAVVGAILAQCGSSNAEEMRIRAGEHDDFTRLVLAFDTLPPWRAARSDNGYQIDFEGSDALLYDLSRAFALIRRDRIDRIDIDASARRVRMGLACECYAEIFDLNGTTLVLDVRDGRDPTETRPAEREIRDEQPGNMQQPLWAPPALLVAPEPEPQRQILGGRADPQVTRPPTPSQVSLASELDRTTSGSAQFPEITSSGGSFAIAQLPTIDQIPQVNSIAIDVLTKQLGRAASQGLIDVERDNTILDPGPRSAVLGPQNFRAFTGIDRASAALDGSIGATSEGMACIPDTMVDLQNWGDPTGAKELGRLRSGVVRETGAPDPDGLRALARYYLSMGFGAEARFAASKLSQSQERAVLLALADIVDHGKSDAALFEGQLACPGRIALWAALAGPFSRSDLPVSTDVILTTFSALPPHLREHLGPVLSQRLRNAGETALARAALSAVTRLGPGSVGQDLTAARLELSGTRAAEAREELERIAQGTSVEAAEALLELLQDARRRKIAPKPEWVDDAETLIRVTEGTRIAEDLTVEKLRGHIPLGRFDELRRALTAGRPGLTEGMRRDIAAEALAASVRDADDETFLRTELGLSDFADPDALDATTRFEIVARYLELGLASAAAKYLPDEIASIEEQRLSVATQLALGDLAEALSRLGAEPDIGLSELNASIRAGLGDFVEASVLLNEAGNFSAAELQALRSGDWQWISDQGPEDLSSTVRTATAPPFVNNDTSQNSALIDDVATRRAAYVQLLSRTQPVVGR